MSSSSQIGSGPGASFPTRTALAAGPLLTRVVSSSGREGGARSRSSARLRTEADDVSRSSGTADRQMKSGRGLYRSTSFAAVFAAQVQPQTRSPHRFEDLVESTCA